MSFSKDYALKKFRKIGQLYDGQDYKVHLLDVAVIIRKEKDKIPKQMLDGLSRLQVLRLKSIFSDSAWLHDNIEDTDDTREILAQLFEQETADIVHHVSDEKRTDINRKTKKIISNERMSQLDETVFTEWAALVLKAADRLSNWRYSVLKKDKKKIKMYYKEHQAFKKAVWRKGVAVHTWRVIDKLEKFVEEKYGFSHD